MTELEQAIAALRESRGTVRFLNIEQKDQPATSVLVTHRGRTREHVLGDEARGGTGPVAAIVHLVRTLDEQAVKAAAAGSHT